MPKKDPAKAETPNPDKTPKAVPPIEAPKPTPRSAPHAKLQTLLANLKFPTSTKVRILALAGAAALILVVAFAIPYTRYGMLGQVFKRPVILEVLDTRNHKPVSDVTITIGAKKVKTDSKGQAKFAQIPVGGWEVSADKKYYNLVRTSIMVPLLGSLKTYHLELASIGNQVTVKATNKITGKPLAKAAVEALGTTATTDATGEAVIVLPTNRTTETGTIKAGGYNDLAITVTNSEAATPANTFALTPTGKLYYLSKRTGTINVMKSDLDGANPQVVLAGTGKESETDTVLLATRDWKYLALKSKREGAKTAKLYVINTATGKLDLMDEGANVEFNPVGWSDHYFVYNVTRNDVSYWRPKRLALKSYNADKDAIRTIDETAAEGSQYDSAAESFGSAYLIDNTVVYTKSWDGQYYHLTDKKMSILSSKLPDGAKQTLKDFSKSSANSISSRPYEAKGVAFQLSDWTTPTTTNTYFEYEDGKLASSSDINADTFSQPYVSYYIQSPSNNLTFWYEPRDGKNTLFKGDDDGKNAKTLAELSEYQPYGWFTDDYMLVSKKGSELYIAPADFSAAPIKVTDYHKPNFTSLGYGGGYGGGF